MRVLSKEDLVRIHQLTQKVIENKGCRGSGKDTRPRNLSAFFPGLSYAGPLDVKPGETHYIYDFEANRSLDCTETDIADKLLVLDNSLTNIEYDCCNLFTPLGRGIGSPVVSTYDSSEACEVFCSSGGCVFYGLKRLPLSIRNSRQEESRLTVLGHAILEGLDATELILKDDTRFPWVTRSALCNIKSQ